MSTIKERREIAGFSQETVARKVGVSLNTIRRWERNPDLPERHVREVEWALEQLLAEEPDHASSRDHG